MTRARINKNTRGESRLGRYHYDIVRILTAITAILVPVLALAQSTYTWKPVVIGGGGFVDGIVFDPNSKNTIYCRTDVGGAYRWNDTTQKWIPLLDFLGVANNQSNLMGVESLAIDPLSGGTLYLGCGLDYDTTNPSGPSAILISTNYGASFTQVSVPFAIGGNNNGPQQRRTTGCRSQPAVHPLLRNS
jgi:hypothetical protein